MLGDGQCTVGYQDSAGKGVEAPAQRDVSVRGYDTVDDLCTISSDQPRRAVIFRSKPSLRIGISGVWKGFFMTASE